jgi:WhiB family redox-sensing transcriptional regulator
MTLEQLNALLDEVGETPCMSAPNLFFIEKDEKGYSANDARKLCGMCPIRADCAAYALENRERYGIWGGMTWNERKALIRRNGVR